MPLRFRLYVKYLLTLALCFGIKQGFSFSDRALRGRDTSYIHVPKYKWNLRLQVVDKFSSTTFISALDSIPEARFKPNENLGVGAGIFYNGFGGYIGFSLPSSPSDLQSRGRTRRLDIQINQYGKKLGFDVQFQYFKGFYLDNTREFRPNISANQVHILRPDLRSFTAGLSGYWIFNSKKYSMKAAFIQTEKQKKSAGSFLLGYAMSLYAFNADSALLPDYFRLPGREEDYQRGRFSSASLSLGYAYCFVIRKDWYFNIALSGGGGLLHNKVNYESGGVSRGFSPVLRWQIRSAIGYNGERRFFGVKMVNDVYNLPLNAARLEYTFGNMRLFYGFRIF